VDKYIFDFRYLRKYPTAWNGSAMRYVCHLDPTGALLDSLPVQPRRSMVDLALRLNVLAVCAAIAFVGAILIMF